MRARTLKRRSTVARKVADIIAEVGKSLPAPRQCMPDLTSEDKRIIDSWLAEQRLKEKPESNDWLRLLFERKPLFRDLTYDSLRGKWVDFIDYCGTSLDLSSLDEMQATFPILGDQGIGYLLRALDVKKVALYESFVPILLFKGAIPAVYRINAKGEDHVSVSEAMAEDVVNIAVLEWLGGKPKLKRARERLCDLMSMCLAKA